MNHKWYKNPAKNWTDTSLVSSNDSIFLRKSVMFLDHRLRSFECLFKCLAFGFTCQPLISMKKLTYQQVWILRRYLYMFTICKYIYLLYLTKEWFILLYYITSSLIFVCSKNNVFYHPKNEKHHEKKKENTQFLIGLLVSLTWFQPLEEAAEDPNQILDTSYELGNRSSHLELVPAEFEIDGVFFWWVFLGGENSHGLNLRAKQKPPWYGCFQK